jgi:hypothetical protein
MPGDDHGSVTRWIANLKNGEDSAPQRLWERYFARMVELARTRLRAGGRKDVASDEEAAALSAFDSFCEGVARGRFPQLSDRDDLWRLLVVITARKVNAHVRRQFRLAAGTISHRLDIVYCLVRPNVTCWSPGSSRFLFERRRHCGSLVDRRGAINERKSRGRS